MRHPHGSYVRYFKDRCRCEKCVTAQRERVRANRAERLASARVSHGSRSAYDAGCRCEDCRSARRDALDRDRDTYRLRKARRQRVSA